MKRSWAAWGLVLVVVGVVVGCVGVWRLVEVALAFGGLVVEHSGVSIHVDVPVSLGIDDTGRADALIRCVQEIITNTSRHAAARNLWIRLDVRGDGVTLEAHDDGRGAASIDYGNGLKGMRERFEAHAGHVEFGWGQGTGFRVHGCLPMPVTP